MSHSTDIHVVPDNGSWIVKQEGVARAPSVHATKAEAVAEARRLAARDDVVLVTHNPDGRAGEQLEVDIHRLAGKFAELISAAGPQTEITVTDGGVPRAKLLPLGNVEPQAKPAENKPRVLGLHPGSVLWIAEDFDDPLPAEFWLGNDA